jgi:hypothetical protein
VLSVRLIVRGSDWPVDGRAVEAPSRGYRGSMNCRIAGCSDLVKAKGLCNRHYLKLRRYGDRLAVPARSARSQS